MGIKNAKEELANILSLVDNKITEKKAKVQVKMSENIDK